MRQNSRTETNDFGRELFEIAIPVTLQSLLQSSFSVVDQIMTGQLGSVDIAGIGIAGKFASIYSVVIAAVAAVAGIQISQYEGRNDEREAAKSLWTNLLLALFLALFVTAAGIFVPTKILGLYTKEIAVIQTGGSYLGIYAVSFLPQAVTVILSAFLRCAGQAKIPLYASLCAAFLNTGLNYLLIFGRCGFPALGADGAALASVVAQYAGCLLIFLLFVGQHRKNHWRLSFCVFHTGEKIVQYAAILLPMLVCEFFWSLGENVYAGIYGHIGTRAFAAMSLTNSVQALVIGALSGVAQAAGIMVGKRLGAGEEEQAYQVSKKLMAAGWAGAIALALCVVLGSGAYVQIFNVEEEVRLMTRQILFVYALVVPIKVQNMIVGGGVLRSGGKTVYAMAIDLTGTWGFGVPLGLLAAFVWKLPIAAVYFALSLEEGVRLLISLVLFRRRVWMRRI